MPVKTVPSVIIGSGSNKSIVNNIYNNDFGNTIITGYLTVDYYLTVDGNLTVGGSFDLSGDITVKNPSDVTVFSVDSATGDTLTKGDITVKNPSDVTVFSVDSVTGDTLTKGDITVNNPSDVTVFSVDSATGDTLTKGDITVKNVSNATVFSVDSATGDTIVEGNLTVNGTTTTIDSVTLVVEDPVITLAKNASSNPTASTDAGLFLQRGSTENPALFIWNETLDQFELATVTGATSTTTDFTVGVTKSFSNLFVGQLRMNTFSNTDTPAVFLNLDNSYYPTKSVVAVEVERGQLTNTYIKWDEFNERWDINNNINSRKLKISTSDSSGTTRRVFLYVYHDANVYSEQVFFYIYKTSTFGNFRDTFSLQNLNARIFPYNLDYSQIWLSHNNNTAYTIHASADAYIDMVVGETYYINVYSNNGSSLYSPTVSFGFSYSSDVGLTTAYTTVTNASMIASGFSGTGFNAVIQVDNATPLVPVLGLASPIAVRDNIDNYPSLRVGYSKGLGHIVLNSGTITPSDNATILVDRGTSTHSYIKWDETNDRWDFNYGFYLNTDSQIKIEKPTTPATTPAILLNADMTGAGQEADVIAIEVERGTETNSYIKWDETNGGRWDFNYGFYLNTDSQIKIEKFTTPSTTPAILLNADETVAPTKTVIAVEVERGTENNSYIKWDESNDRWEVSNDILTYSLSVTEEIIEDNRIPVYFYFKYNSQSNANSEFFYIFSTEDNGVTRDVIPLKIITTTQFSENLDTGFYRYKSNQSLSYNNTSPTPTYNAIAYLNPNKTYYFFQQTLDLNYTGIGASVIDFQVFVSKTILPDPPTYRNVFGVDPLGTINLVQIVYELVMDQTWTDNDIVYKVVDLNYVVSSLSEETSASNSDFIPLRITSKQDTLSITPTILFNSDVTGVPSKSVQIEVERGTSTNSYIKWDETNDRWDFNYGLNIGSQLTIEYMTVVGTPAILLNADRTGSSDEADVVAIEVERGTLPNAKIKWDETNGDRWDFNYGFYLNTDSQIKIEKFTTPATTPAILLNADETGAPSSDVIAIEVGRGTETNAKITWDEGSDRWDFNYGLYLNGRLSIAKTSAPDSISSILINADCTTDGSESNAFALNVARGILGQAYLKWDESNIRWSISHDLKVNNDLSFNKSIYGSVQNFTSSGNTIGDYSMVFVSNGATPNFVVNLPTYEQNRNLTVRVLGTGTVNLTITAYSGSGGVDYWSDIHTIRLQKTSASPTPYIRINAGGSIQLVSFNNTWYSVASSNVDNT